MKATTTYQEQQSLRLFATPDLLKSFCNLEESWKNNYHIISKTNT
jgi:hypothetical protein